MRHLTHQFVLRVKELDRQAEQVTSLAYGLATGQNVQPHLLLAGQSWYRSARELLAQNDFSGLQEFERCYRDWVFSPEWQGHAEDRLRHGAVLQSQYF